MRILLLTQWFEPEPTFKGLLFARELRARGHEVEVLTGFPNYPGGHVYPGYKVRPWKRTEIDGISILRVALYPSHSESAFGRVLNYTSFTLSAAIVGTALIKKPDVIYVYHPPATVGMAAVAIGLMRGAPFVYDVQDLWPDTVAVSGLMSKPAPILILDKLCNFVYRSAGHIVVLSPGFKKQLVRRGVPSKKIDVIYNWCDETAIQKIQYDLQLAVAVRLSGMFNVMFAGTIGTAQALDSILEAAVLCQTNPTIQFLIVGGGVDRERLERRAVDLSLRNVRFLPRQPMDSMGAVLALADLLLIHLKDDPLFSITIPSKTQAYMASGKPILMAVRGDAARLVAQSGGGLSCEPENPKKIAEMVVRFSKMSPESRRDMGEAGKRFYYRELSLKSGVTEFETIFKRVRGGSVAEPRDLKRNSMDISGASAYQRFLKRAIDLFVSTAVLIGISPLLLVIGLCSRLLLGKPTLFQQIRPGFRQKLFTIYKFRTMRNAVDRDGKLLPDALRLTRFGSFLRQTSLDELPELWNVLRGDMSLVGPRPLLPQYLSRYSPTQRRRHDVKPGITGWAQVNGRNSLSWEQKFDLDVWYVDHMDFWLDVKILWSTFLKVARRDGISHSKGTTMPEFLGTSRGR